MISSLNNNYNYTNLNSVMSSKVFNASPVGLTPQNPNASDIQVSSVKVRQSQESNYNNNVYFRDPTNNTYVSVGLSDENLQRLQEVFGSQSVKKDDNGNVLLQGKAEEFVSSWFNDIAYKRGYVNADTNQDGFLDSTERLNTNSFTNGLMYSNGSKDVNLSSDENYTKFISSGNTEYDNVKIDKQSSNSIEAELNRMIELDNDADGSVTFNQLWDTKEFTQYLDKIINDSGKNNKKNSLFDSLLSIDEFLKPLEEMNKNSKQMMKEELEKIAGKNGIQNQVSNQTQSLTTENSADENSTLEELMKLTKLDKDTLKYNIKNNPNFKDNLISIVNQLTQNVDSMYASNTLTKKSIDIYA